MENSFSKPIKRLNHLIGEIDAVYHDASLRLGISDSISKILYTLCNSGDCCLLSEICRQTGLSKQTVNSALRKLESDDIVILEAVNRKAKSVRLTEAGKEFSNQTARRLIDIENQIFDSWTGSDVKQYLDLTEKFLLSLKAKIQDL